MIVILAIVHQGVLDVLVVALVRQARCGLWCGANVAE